MSATQRLFALIQEIEVRPGQTARNLAGRFDVSERTIQRDVDERLPALGVMVKNDNGYRFEQKPFLKSLALSREEIVAVVLAQQVAEKHLDQTAAAALRCAVDKLRRGFCAQGRLTADKLEERTAVSPGPQTEADLAQTALSQLTEAASRQQEVSFDYQGRADQQAEQRLVEPLGLFLQEGRWYLYAFDQKRRGFRTFRLGRMSNLLLSSRRFEAKAKFNAELASFHEWDIAEGQPVEFTLELSTGLARWFAENKPHPSVQVDGTRATLSVTDPKAFLRWFASLDGAELVGPAEHRETFRARLEQVIQRYRSP